MSFEHRHENKSCSACPKDQNKHLTFNIWHVISEMWHVIDSMTNNHFWAYTWTFKHSDIPGSQLLSDVQTFLSLGTAGLVLILNSSDLVFFNQKSLILPKNRPISVNNPIFIRLFYKIFTPVTYDIWQHDKQSLSSLHMKTKVVQHVPRIHTPQSRTEKNIFFKDIIYSSIQAIHEFPFGTSTI